MMLDFQPITLADRAKIAACLSLAPSKQLVDCFEAFYLWRDVLQVEWANYEEFVLFRVHYESGVPSFLFPFGAGDPTAALTALRAYQKAQNAPLRLAKVRPEQLEYLERAFPGQYTATAPNEHAEYLYDTDIFRTYAGKALQPKRNFVNYARANFDWHYEAITPDNLTECQAFASSFDGDDSFNDDSAALQNALAEFEKLSLAGGLIRTGEAISALFICAPLGDGATAAGLFLRGDHNKKGVIPLLYQVYFLHHTEFRWFNFGEDLGVEGLRKNKRSFHPTEILDLYDAIIL